ncbi:hypothetical protein HJC23_005475 [Cyclotella cryptica]|uniref:subtilisin n=1 Tax=Cyclotella cryptica TaxID=29204 RepID=A0ABD3PK82_9STRA|eukprot:CCRYP_013959-RA/>CCRYP_013959-RA protein AED:0.01 eAED:0.01 QI:170/1/1/1/1/1/2/21/1122
MHVICSFAAILLSVSSICSTIADVESGAINGLSSKHSLTHQEFSKILLRSIDDEITLQHFTVNYSGRNLEGTDTGRDEIWNGVLQHGWDTIEYSTNGRLLRSENASTYFSPFDSSSLSNKHPFLLCSSYPVPSGYLRLQRILLAFNTTIDMSQTVYNAEESSCFIIVSSSHVLERAFELSQQHMGNEVSDLLKNVTFGPLVDVLKLAAGTPSMILNDEDWQEPVLNMYSSLRNGKDRISPKPGAQRKWKRSLMIDLIPGSHLALKLVNGSVHSIARDVVDFVEAMANASKTAQDANREHSNLRSLGVGTSSNGIMSLRQAFSLTSATSSPGKTTKMILRSNDDTNVWSNALIGGFESRHGCQNMFDLIEIRPRGSLDDSAPVIGFELLLNAPEVTDDKRRHVADSSALNKQCALSLIMGLSVHPMVQTVEVSPKIELAMAEGASNPQWITQSSRVNSRPFFDKGLDGRGQIVAVADGGLDRDNCYFRDVNEDASMESIFGSSWNLTRRKIVNYDDSFADRKEIPMGHGTHVSGIVAGRKSFNGVDEATGYADGVAPGSKIAFFDMEIEDGGIQDPGVSRLFSSFYNSGKGAKIMNASWGRGYNGVYSAFCRDYDSMLSTKYSDVLLVVSAGNTGVGGHASSIQNPADCKNSLGVGASLSYGNDIRSREKGIEYLADYSSRGPTFDGRMKPDIVAPGHFILAPNADPSRFGECDGSAQPDVKSSLSAGKGARYVSGTSMSSPVVAGSASIVRQYFEEGWCTEDWCCGAKGCGTSINPSGSLLKAILLNGAQPLHGGVQGVPDGIVFQDDPIYEYDNIQGAGRVNLLNSLPLTGENNIQMMIVNDKGIIDGAKDEYNFQVDLSNGCNSEVQVTLVWYDPPGAVGCTNCVMNDLDLYMENIDGSEILYPNGLFQRDKKNTVERIRTQVSEGLQFRVVVHARNFATSFQRYSLAVSGCLAEADDNNSRSTSSSSENNPGTQVQSARSASNDEELLIHYTSHDCEFSQLFELEITTGEAGSTTKWDLLGSSPDNTSTVIAYGPKSSSFENNAKYYFSVCLDPQRYIFRIREKNEGSFRVSFGGTIMVDSERMQDMDTNVTFRFKVNANGHEYIKRAGQVRDLDGESI